jgi:hypothetical protein
MVLEILHVYRETGGQTEQFYPALCGGSKSHSNKQASWALFILTVYIKLKSSIEHDPTNLRLSYRRTAGSEYRICLFST